MSTDRKNLFVAAVRNVRSIANTGFSDDLTVQHGRFQWGGRRCGTYAWRIIGMEDSAKEQLQNTYSCVLTILCYHDKGQQQ